MSLAGFRVDCSVLVGDCGVTFFNKRTFSLVQPSPHKPWLVESRESGFVVQVRGYTMRRTRVANSEQMMWNLPEKACVSCLVNPNIMSADSADVDCEATCLGHDGSAGNEETELDFVSRHMRVCLQEHKESIEQQDVCSDAGKYVFQQQ